MSSNNNNQSQSSDSVDDDERQASASPELVEQESVEKSSPKEMSSSSTDIGLGERLRLFDEDNASSSTEHAIADHGVAVQAAAVDQPDQGVGEENPSRAVVHRDEPESPDAPDSIISDEASMVLNQLSEIISEHTGDSFAAQIHLEAFRQVVEQIGREQIIANSTTFVEGKIEELLQGPSVALQESYWALRDRLSENFDLCVYFAFLASYAGEPEFDIVHTTFFGDLADHN